MDFMTILGLIIGAAAVYYTMAVGGILSILFNKVAFILVFGGTLGSTLITYPWKIIKHLPKSFLLVFFPPKQLSFDKTIEKLTKLANIATSRGIDELHSELDNIEDDFLISGVGMLLENIDDEVLKENMERDILSSAQRHQRVITAFRSMGSYSPVFGLLGTLIGIVQVLRNLSDPTTMGSAMSVAITTTFYGIFGANFIFLPAAGKLEIYSTDELILKELQMIGILSIKKQTLPVLMRRKLEKFLSKKIRESRNKNP